MKSWRHSPVTGPRKKGQAACQNILASNPDIDLFFDQADDMVMGCARAVSSVGSDAKLVGFGGSKWAIVEIKAGNVDGTVCYKPEEIGRISFKVLHDVANDIAHSAEFITDPTLACKPVQRRRVRRRVRRPVVI